MEYGCKDISFVGKKTVANVSSLIDGLRETLHDEQYNV